MAAALAWRGLLSAQRLPAAAGPRACAALSRPALRSPPPHSAPHALPAQLRGLQRHARTGRPVACQAVDPWSVSTEGLASQLFAASLLPYLGFLYLLRKAQGPPLTFFGFAFLLVFVFATIPAGIYAKVHYETSLANVDWLHGTAESLLTVTNVIIVLGLRRAFSEAAKSTDGVAEQKVEKR